MSRAVKIGVLSFLLLGVISAQSAFADYSGYIRGYVLKSNSLTGIPGVICTTVAGGGTNKGIDTTDVTGHYSLGAMQNNHTWDVYFYKPGLISVDVSPVDVANHSTTTLTITMTAATPTVTGLSPTSGYNNTNTTITITGTGFWGGLDTSDVAWVKLDDGPTTSLTVVSVPSDSTITAIVPSLLTPGSYNVTVSNMDAHNTTSAQKFRVLAAPGILKGNVTSSTYSSALPGALVEALIGASVEGTATTDGSGDYVMPAIQPGTYDVESSAEFTEYSMNECSPLVFSMFKSIPLKAFSNFMLNEIIRFSMPVKKSRSLLFLCLR